MTFAPANVAASGVDVDGNGASPTAFAGPDTTAILPASIAFSTSATLPVPSVTRIGFSDSDAM